jgi:DNA-binding transcriptional LysR family regulator
MRYRPEGWENNFTPDKIKDIHWYPVVPCDHCWAAFENGADALLEKLRQRGHHCENYLVDGKRLKGTLVFIPDDKQ